MEFGKLTTPQAMEQYFQQMRQVSRTELLNKLYQTEHKQSETNDENLDTDITNAFIAIMENYNFDHSSTIVKQILTEFEIDPADICNLKGSERHREVSKRIKINLQSKLAHFDQLQQDDTHKNSNNPEQNAFDWVGIKSNFLYLRSIFQEILLEKVRLFDEQLSQLTNQSTKTAEKTNEKINFKISPATTQARTFSVRQRVKTEPQKRQLSRLNLKKKIDSKGFTNVLIRDHSQFTLTKWTQRQQLQFRQKMENFRKNFNKNGQKSPIIFQFVKQFTKTVKARDNISKKFENRQKMGITPQQLKYLCSTSLFLNKTLTISEKNRLNKNIHSLGKDMISKLQFNISQKIIETYKQFMKKVADLRAHYYEQLTEKRKKEYSIHKKREQKLQICTKKRNQFVKFRQIFGNICKSQKMKILLNPRVSRWVKLFIENLKKKAKKGNSYWGNKQIFNRLAAREVSPLVLKSKMKAPSTRIIKREDHTKYRHYITKHVATERFFYDSSFERHINKFNAIKVKNPKVFRKQLTGGPNKEKREFIIVDIMTKQIKISSKKCIKAVVMIQAKWKSIYMRKKFQRIVEDYRERELLDFEERRKSLKRLYPHHIVIDLKALQERLKRVSMRNFKTFKPYQKVIRKPINLYTSFSSIKLSLNEQKIKNILNNSQRMAAFGIMVEKNDFKKILKSGYVLTAKEINEPIYKDGGSLMWWSVKNSNINLARVFLQGGGDPNSKNFQLNTCLHEAIKNGDLELIFLLLDYGADLSAKNNRRQTPKFFATPKMLKWLGIQEPKDDISRDTGSNFFGTRNRSESIFDNYR